MAEYKKRSDEFAGEGAAPGSEETYVANKDWRRGSVPVADLISRFVDPLCARRGLSSSALLHAWDEIVGPHLAECTMPEKIRWDRTSLNQKGTLIVRVDGPRAIYVQHEQDQILERINRFLGFHAVQAMKIIQAPIARRPSRGPAKKAKLSERQERQLREYIGEFEDTKLQETVIAMGRQVLLRALHDKNKK